MEVRRIGHGHFVTGDGSRIPTRSVSVYAKDGDEWKWLAGGMSALVKNELLSDGSPLAQEPATAA